MSKTTKKEKQEVKPSKKKLIEKDTNKQNKKLSLYHWAVEVNEYRRKAGLNSEQF